MDKLLEALAPIFAAGFAVQRLLEILDPLTDLSAHIKQYKAAIAAAVSFVVGFGIAMGAGLHVMQTLGINGAGIADTIVTALVISAGTESVNSILKYMQYSKDVKGDQAVAAANQPDIAAGRQPLVNRQPVGR